jgi:hypothetical protein
VVADTQRTLCKNRKECGTRKGWVKSNVNCCSGVIAFPDAQETSTGRMRHPPDETIIAQIKKSKKTRKFNGNRRSLKCVQLIGRPPRLSFRRMNARLKGGLSFQHPMQKGGTYEENRFAVSCLSCKSQRSFRTKSENISPQHDS